MMLTKQEAIVVVSADTHIGPRLAEDLRPYCPGAALADFDDYVNQDAAYRAAVVARENPPRAFTEVEPGKWVRSGHNMKTAGHYDVHARLHDMNYDGVAAEVIFHGSTNDEPIPFTSMGDPSAPEFFVSGAPKDPERAALGRHIYNSWLADVCSVEPHRHVGLAQVPIWDVAATVRELEWARGVGLSGVNFPAPQPWFPAYQKPDWEPLWSAAEALDMPLVTHLGGASDMDYSGVAGFSIKVFEDAVITGRRILPWLIYAGVFERHPGLKLVVTEVPGTWWPQLLHDMDSVWNIRNPYFAEDDQINSPSKRLCPKPPSEYCRTNVFVGASFMSRSEAEAASRDGYYCNMMWGSDYPHIEGTYYHPDSEQDMPMTHIALSNAFHGLPDAHVHAMLGDNALTVFGLDAQKLASVAQDINSPTMASIDRQLPVPAHAASMAFRSNGIWD